MLLSIDQYVAQPEGRALFKSPENFRFHCLRPSRRKALTARGAIVPVGKRIHIDATLFRAAWCEVMAEEVEA